MATTLHTMIAVGARQVYQWRLSEMQYSVFRPRRNISPSTIAGVATKNSSFIVLVASTSNFSPILTTTTSPSSEAIYSLPFTPIGDDLKLYGFGSLVI